MNTHETNWIISITWSGRRWSAWNPRSSCSPRAGGENLTRSDVNHLCSRSVFIPQQLWLYFSISSQGPPGEMGPQGPPGPTGAPVSTSTWWNPSYSFSSCPVVRENKLKIKNILMSCKRRKHWYCCCAGRGRKTRTRGDQRLGRGEGMTTQIHASVLSHNTKSQMCSY